MDVTDFTPWIRLAFHFQFELFVFSDFGTY
jgi:hypothetical protein